MFFKDVLGKALGIDDQTNTKAQRPQQWNKLSLNFNTTNTHYTQQYKPKKPQFKEQPSERGFFETHRTSTKMKPYLKTSYN